MSLMPSGLRDPEPEDSLWGCVIVVIVFLVLFVGGGILYHNAELEYERSHKVGAPK